MFEKLVEGSDVLSLPVLAMLFFIAIFAVVLVRALSRRRRAHYDRMARMPLDDSDAPEGNR